MEPSPRSPDPVPDLARGPGPSVRVRVHELGERTIQREDRLATEEPLEIRLAWPGREGHRVWMTMRTPGHDFELTAGWAHHEGLLSVGLRTIAYCTDTSLARDQEFNVVTLTLDRQPDQEPHQHDALSAGSSACGVCGRESLGDALAARSPQPYAGPEPTPDLVRSLPDLLRRQQPLFDRTGGVHAAGLVTADGEVLAVREDVGRHNAVDKVAGARLLAGEPTEVACLVVSGRAGFELVQKAIASGVGSLVAVGAPTSLARDLAREGGLALYGFTRPQRTVRYC